ncbi:hypothetical protein PIB30_109233, partial [Stylosanthes scabra]|nr:hypothetical protein [Stylosanthes scabra]
PQFRELLLNNQLKTLRICVEEHAYACYMKSSLSRLGVVTKPILCTHRHRRPPICVVNEQATQLKT